MLMNCAVLVFANLCVGANRKEPDSSRSNIGPNFTGNGPMRRYMPSELFTRSWKTKMSFVSIGLKENEAEWRRIDLQFRKFQLSFEL